MATQLYDSESQAIYPNTQADAVSVNTGEKDINNVQTIIDNIKNQEQSRSEASANQEYGKYPKQICTIRQSST